MHFNKAQIMILAVLLVMVGILIYLNYKTPEANLQPTQSAVGKEQKPFDFDSYLSHLGDSISLPSKLQMEELTKKAAETNAGVFSIARVAQGWDSLGFRLASAYYLEKVANKVNDENTWFNAGLKYYEFAATCVDTAMQLYATTGAIRAFEKVIVLNENNVEAKNALAICYIQNDLDIMKGVQLLKDVTKRDSNNIEANYTLGMLSMRSGQMDKAVQRFLTLTKLQPMNPEYYYYLGEAYQNMDKKQDAIKAFEKFQSLVPDEQEKKNIEVTINNLKNSK